MPQTIRARVQTPPPLTGNAQIEVMLNSKVLPLHQMAQFALVTIRVAEVGVLAETAKYPSMLARSARLQIFATKNTVFYNCKFLQHKRRFFGASADSPALALKALC